ncbi:MAG: hypothetical protein ACR2OJ_09165 [Hyphomicrobiales bacterium]
MVPLAGKSSASRIKNPKCKLQHSKGTRPMASAQETQSRFGKLVKDLAFALLNATLMLIIIACVCVILMINRINTAGQELAQTAVDAAVASVGEKPKETITKLTELLQSLKDIKAELAAGKNQDSETPKTSTSFSSGTMANGHEEKISKLTTQVEELNTKIDQLLDKKEWLTDEFLKKTGLQVSNTLIRVRDCKLSTSLE